MGIPVIYVRITRCLATEVARMAKPIQLFEQASLAHLYSKYRPTYPKELLGIICDYVKRKGGKLSYAVDVACGPGESTFHLLGAFEKCLGVDISRAQVEEAKKKAAELPLEDSKRIEFKVGMAENLPVESESVDLVGCAQAWHWMQPPEGFFKEVKRVLKPYGTLAVYGYSNCVLCNEECNKKLTKFYGGTLKGYWHSNRQFVDRQYRDVELPFAETERHDMTMPMSLPLSHFIGYVSSWSGYCKYMECNAGSTILEDLKENIRSILLQQPEQEKEEEVVVDLVFPVYVILGLKK